MRLRVNPFLFLLRLVALLLVTYFWIWGYVSPYYAQLLVQSARVGMRLSELTSASTTRIAPRPGRCTDTAGSCLDSSDCNTGASCYQPPGGCARPQEVPCTLGGPDNACGSAGFCAPVGNGAGRCFQREGVCLEDKNCRDGARCVPTNVYYHHPSFARVHPPLPPQGIPAEWIMASSVLLFPLMLATPAATWRSRFVRLGIAFAAILTVQALDVVITIKAFYASAFPDQYGSLSRNVYAFLNSFFQGYDTQLFPFAVWAGIHFRDLLALRHHLPAPQPRSESPKRKERK